MADAGAALVIEDSELVPGVLARAVNDLFANPGHLEEMATAARGLGRTEKRRLRAKR